MTATLLETPSANARMRSAWGGAHTPVAGVTPRAASWATLVPLLLLPSCTWRLALTLNAPIVDRDAAAHATGPVATVGYALFLAAFSELLAFAAVGLVAAWGEVFPRWIPCLRGRRVPVSFAAVPAALASIVLTAGTIWFAISAAAEKTIQWRPAPPADPWTQGGWHEALATIAYAPLLLWGPALSFLTVAYVRRRRG